MLPVCAAKENLRLRKPEAEVRGRGDPEGKRERD